MKVSRQSKRCFQLVVKNISSRSCCAGMFYHWQYLHRSLVSWKPPLSSSFHLQQSPWAATGAFKGQYVTNITEIGLKQDLRPFVNKVCEFKKRAFFNCQVFYKPLHQLDAEYFRNLAKLLAATTIWVVCSYASKSNWRKWRDLQNRTMFNQVLYWTQQSCDQPILLGVFQI